MNTTRYKRSDVQYASLCQTLGVQDLGDSVTLIGLSQRQGVNADLIMRLLPDYLRRDTKPSDLESVLADALYSGYVQNQTAATARVNLHDALRVPDNFNYRAISGLSNEMVERLERTRPQTFGQARKINGLTPAALSTLLVHLTAKASHAQAA